MAFLTIRHGGHAFHHLGITSMPVNAMKRKIT